MRKGWLDARNEEDHVTW